MGFKVPELKANSKAPLEAGTWDMEFQKFVAGVSSQKKTPFVQAIFKVTDPEAVDTAGEPYGKRPFYGDTFYLTEPAMFRIHNFASDAGVDLGELDDEYSSVKEYAAAVTELFDGVEVAVETEIEDYEKKDGSTGYKSVVVEYNFG